jgi:predicted TIM-barrel fold metal-dependent hydrolase
MAQSPLDVLDDLYIIDCDTHYTEPPDLWTSRVPSSVHDQVPTQRTTDGFTSWYLNDDLWAGVGGNTLRKGHEKVLGTHTVQPWTEIDPAAWDVASRLNLMDEMGIYAQVLYPNGIGFASSHIFAIDDEEQRLNILRTYNDFLVDTFKESKGRLIPQALLPVWDMQETLREMTRLLDSGIRGFTLSDKPELLGLPELPRPYFDPMWDLFDKSGAVASFHIASGMRKADLEALRASRLKKAVPEDGDWLEDRPTELGPSWRSFGHQRRLVVLAAQIPMSNMRIVANLCMSDLFDRFPGVKIVSAESGIGWVPFLLESLEFQTDEMITDVDERSYQKRRPTDYFRDHISVMFWYEKLAPATIIEHIGVNNVLIETDIPHPTCLYPGAREHFAKVMQEVDPWVRKRVLQDNAVELYNINLPSNATAEPGWQPASTAPAEG